MALNVPLMILTMAVSIVLIQIWFLGLFRPNSKDAQVASVGVEGEELANKVITEQLTSMGPMTFHEKSVAIMFISAIILWFLRKPQFIPGWAELITKTKVGVEEIKKGISSISRTHISYEILKCNFETNYFLFKLEVYTPKYD